MIKTSPTKWERSCREATRVRVIGPARSILTQRADPIAPIRHFAAGWSASQLNPAPSAGDACMIPIRGLFEAHLTVATSTGRSRSIATRSGLPLAHVIPERQVAFFWVPTSDKAMLGLWCIGTSPLQMRLHIAFDVTLDDVIGSVEKLRAAGLTPRVRRWQRRSTNRSCCAGCRRQACISMIRTGIRWNSSPCCRTGRGRNWGAWHGRNGGGRHERNAARRTARWLAQADVEPPRQAERGERGNAACPAGRAGGGGGRSRVAVHCC